METLLFNAWKDVLSDKTYNEMPELFERTEKQIFEHDSFEDAARFKADDRVKHSSAVNLGEIE